MATKKKKVKQPVFETDELTLEDQLYNVRRDIAELTDLSKKLAAQLLEDMLAKHQTRTDKFRVSVRKTLRITDPDIAFKWAAERHCIDVNTTKAMQLIRRELHIPDGFNIQETNYLTAARHNNETNFDDGDGD